MTASRSRPHVVLVRPEIHWNTGNAGRSCLAAGARLHLVEPLGFSLDERAVRRAGLDYWPRVMPCIWPSWSALEERLAELGPPTLVTPDAERTLWETPLAPSTVFVFGSETTGLADEIRRRFRIQSARIPQPGEDSGVRSLNLSTCVGIALYEHGRRFDRRGRVIPP